MIAGRVRLATVEHKGAKKVAAFREKDNAVFDITSSLGFKDMKSFLETGSDGMQAVKKSIDSEKFKIPLDQVSFKAPIYNPEKIMCVGVNYRDHAKETNTPEPSEPVIFAKMPSAIIAPGDAIVKPIQTSKLDYEAELVVVIGKKAKEVKPENVKDYIAGFMVGHDVTARDWQKGKPGGQWLLGKSFDTFCPIGPWITTGMSVEEAQNLGIRSFVNNKKVQDSNTKEMIFSIDTFISYLSHVVTLKPGDLIFTGTPSGVGIGRNPPLFLLPGDTVTVEVDQLGSITNSVIAPSKL